MSSDLQSQLQLFSESLTEGKHVSLGDKNNVGSDLTRQTQPLVGEVILACVRSQHVAEWGINT